MGPGAQKFITNFQEEINQIRDERLKNLLYRCADQIVPAYFWERPASKGGYHPAFTNGPGGLVRHVKYAAWWLTQNLRCLEAENGKDSDALPSLDICMTGILLHDCMKDGDPTREGEGRSMKAISGCHGVDMAEAMYKRVLNGVIEHEEQAYVLFAVASHMGVWTKPEQFRPRNIKGSKARKICWFMHMADYNASRRVDQILPVLSAFQVK